MGNLHDQSAKALAEAIAAKLVELLPKGDGIAPEYLTPAQVAQLTGFSQKALESYRSRRIGPPFLKVGKAVRYRAADVRDWIESGAVTK